MPPIPHRLTRHYCRECGEMFELPDPNLSGSMTAPHSEVWRHIFHKHRELVRDYEQCSRYCIQRAQTEEITANRRIYGKDLKAFAHVLPERLVMAYDKLFPTDDDHT